MITWRPFNCPECSEDRYQRVVFIGGEFAYECPVCRALHCFSESLYYQFQETWSHELGLRRYVGSYSKGRFLDVDGREIQPRHQRFTVLCEKWQRFRRVWKDEVVGRVTVQRCSHRTANGMYFVASSLHDHFNEAFRGVLRAKDHLLNRRKTETYNILMAFDDGPLRGIVEEAGSKLDGLDEIWWVPFCKTMRWPFAPQTPDLDVGTELNLELTGMLSQKDGIAEVISKRPGPIKQGTEIVRKLLEPVTDVVIQSQAGIPLEGHYMAILLHPDSEFRAGLWTRVQVGEAVDIVADLGERAALPVVDGRSSDAFEDIPGLTVVRLPDLRAQAQFFRDHCKAVLGTNASGCNLPATYGVPIFAFVKGRPFPDDFYCFARMASAYDPDVEPWKGALEQPDNVTELLVDPNAPISPFRYRDHVREWYELHVEHPVLQRGEDELRNGFRAQCPGCTRSVRSREFRLVGSDLCVVLKCGACEEEFVSYRGLTTASEVTVFPVADTQSNRFRDRYLNMLALSRNVEPSRCVERIVRRRSDAGNQSTIAFYGMKPSISDLYYTLPSLFRLRESFPASRLVAVVPRQNEDLLPAGICDELWRVNVDPYLLDQWDFSPVHAELELLLREVGGVTSNFPGKLPFGLNTYRYLRNRLRPESFQRHQYVDVVLYCRLRGGRSWPDAPSLAKLARGFEERQISFRALAFPAVDRVSAPAWLTAAPGFAADPSFRDQLIYLSQCGVCVTPHGASEVPAAIAAPAIIELESEPPHWNEDTPQPVRYGLPPERFTVLSAPRMTEVSTERILETVSRYLGRGGKSARSERNAGPVGGIC